MVIIFQSLPCLVNSYPPVKWCRYWSLIHNSALIPFYIKWRSEPASPQKILCSFSVLNTSSKQGNKNSMNIMYVRNCTCGWEKKKNWWPQPLICAVIVLSVGCQCILSHLPVELVRTNGLIKINTVASLKYVILKALQWSRFSVTRTWSIHRHESIIRGLRDLMRRASDRFLSYRQKTIGVDIVNGKPH